MFRSGIISLCLCAVVVSPTCEVHAFWGSEKMSTKAERAKTVLEGFDAEIEKALNDYKVPGLAIGVVVDGYVVYSKGFGLRDCEKKQSVTPDTLFLIGSCTKAFTSFALGCLIDEGHATWDDRMIDILPSFRLSDQYATQRLTLRDLLSHQTALPRHDLMWYNSQLSQHDILHRLRYLDFASDSCDHFHYNNLTYLAVGLAMENMVDKSWQEIVTQKILSPLGMTHTNFSVFDMQKTSDFAFPYIEKDGELKRMNFRDFSKIAPAGGLTSNVTDMCRWVKLQLDGGQWQQKQLISPATFKEMQSPQVVATGYPESKEEQIRAYGLGWYIQTYGGYRYIMHDGAIDGFTSIVSLLPDEKAGTVILCNKNLTAVARLLAMEVFDRILELPSNDWLKEGLAGVEKNKEVSETQNNETLTHKKGTHPSHPLEDYVGEYENPGYGRIKIELNNGELQVVYNGLTLKLEHWHYDVFNVCDQSEETIISLKNVKFTFSSNLNGDIGQLIVPFEQKAPDVVFTRMPADTLNELTYLRQFAGIYEIYSYTVEILLRNHALYSVIPGQPLYELVPSGKNEFTVKSLAGFSVRFVMDSNEQVQEVLLIQPYGIVYSAKPKRG